MLRGNGLVGEMGEKMWRRKSRAGQTDRGKDALGLRTGTTRMTPQLPTTATTVFCSVSTRVESDDRNLQDVAIEVPAENKNRSIGTYCEFSQRGQAQ